MPGGVEGRGGEGNMKPLLAMSVLGGGARIYFVTRYTVQTLDGGKTILKAHAKHDVTHLFELSRGRYTLRRDMDLAAQLRHYEQRGAKKR